MINAFNYDRLMEIAESQSTTYSGNGPFPHAVIDDFAERLAMWSAYMAFPSPDQLKWFKYNNPLEKKLAMNHVELLPNIHREILYECNSARFVRFLEKLTGINGLIPDPEYIGGGLHQIEKGGKLDIHNDFNWHGKLQLHRRVNVLMYLNHEWKDEYGGHLELWNNEMTECSKKILPIFNRMVCFNTSDFSPHGHPDPLTCPDGVTRKSMALYYYSVTRPESEISPSHSTVYKARPQDDKNLDALREKRKLGRLEDVTI